jgi:hypothetical protein
MLRLVALLVCLVGIAISTAGPRAQDPSACDELTVEGAAPADVNAAVAACEAALAAEPGEPRIVYQYALALERAGRINDAHRMYEWAAADGHGPAIEAVTRLSSTDAEPGWTEAERMALGDSMAGISTAMRWFQNELPPDPSDPLTIIAEIGTDPAVITEWVATNTRLIPYAGSLRGARGVLSDRSGNSLDRALALAALLSTAGEDVRLARASLDEEHAKALLELSRAAQAEPPDFPLQSADQMLATLRASGVGEDVAKTAIDETIAARKRVDATLADQMAALLPLLKQATGAIADTASAALELRALEHLKDHFWVQAKQGDSWVDHDPDAATVGALTPAEVMAAGAVPDQLRHAVTIRVIVEIQAPSGRREETLVSWTGFSADQSDTLVTLTHTTDAMEGIRQLVTSRAPQEQFLAAVDTTSSWTPMLWVGGQVFMDKLFTRDGQVRTVDPNIFTQAGRRSTTVFNEAAVLLGGEQEAPVEVGVPTAEWVEVELTAPGESPRVERRTLFDLLGPARRAGNVTIAPGADQLRNRAMQLAGYSDFLVLGANPSPIELARLTAHAVAAGADALQAVASRPEPLDLATVPQGPHLAWPLRQFARERLTGAGAPAISAPNVFAYHQKFAWDTEALMRSEAEIDIVFNDVAGPQDEFEERVRQGVLDSVLEGALLDGSNSTAADTVADLRAGKTWVLIKPDDERQRLDALDPDLRARLVSELSVGRPVLVSFDGSSRGWWKLDGSGTVLAMRADGGGAAGVEAAAMFFNGIMYGACLYAVGNAIAGEWAMGSAGAICAMAGGAGLIAGSAAGVVPAAYLALGLSAFGGGLAATSP